MRKPVIIGKYSPIEYIDYNFSDSYWTLCDVISGKYEGETVCLIVAYKDKSIVELSNQCKVKPACEGFALIKNKHLDIDIEKHLETNKLLQLEE